MRPTTLCRKLTGVTDLYCETIEERGKDLVFSVRPRWRLPRCSGCGMICPVYDHSAERNWRHLPCGDVVIWLSYAQRRVDCEKCGVLTEQVPWANPRSRFTRALEEQAAYMAQVMDKTAVTRLLGISWRSVGRIVDRIVEQRLSPERLKGLRSIGIDEFSYRKSHRYITIVVDHVKRRVVWTAKGKNADSLSGFFETLGEKQCSAIEQVSIDMSAGFIKAVRNGLPNAKIVFDRFHVQRLVHDALDEVRRAQVRKMVGTEEGKAIKKSRWPLQKNPWNLTVKQEEKLADVQRTNAPLYRAYLLKETLARALDYRQPKRAREALEAWLAWASRSKLEPFVKAARTIRKYKEGILAYIKERHSNARVEGINNRIRMVARRAFGFHSRKALCSMIFLCCGGIELNPALP
jgi:transposase